MQRPSDSDEEFVLEVATSVDDLGPHRRSWKELVDAGTDSNVYMTPEFLEPNLDLVQSDPFVVAFLYRQSPEHRRHLAAVAAFCRKSPTWKRPYHHLVPLENRYFWNPAPLLHPVERRETWSALLTQLVDRRHPWRTVELMVAREVELPGPSRSIAIWDAPGVAALQKPLTREAYDRRRGKSSLQSERRRLRQLRKLGDLRVAVETRVAEGAMEEFLALEAAGWKGSHGTAILSRDPDANFFREVASAAAREGRLVFVTLRLDEKLIGASVMLQIGTTLQAFKLCYDESLRKYSPGLLTATACIDYFLAADQLDIATAGGAADSWQRRFFLDLIPRATVHVAQDKRLSRQFSRGLRIWRALRASMTGGA